MPWSEGNFVDIIEAPPGWFQPGAEPPPVSLPGWTEIRSLLAIAEAQGLTAKQLLFLICGHGTLNDGSGVGHAELVPLLMKGLGNPGIGSGTIPGVIEDMTHNLIELGRGLWITAGKSTGVGAGLGAAVSKLLGASTGVGSSFGDAENALMSANAIANGIGSGPGRLVIPAQTPVTDQRTTVGTFTIDLPWWAMVPGVLVDYALLGGGRGGRGGGAAAPGGGGNRGNWATGTLIYGTHIPDGTTQLVITIAAQSIGSAGNYLVSDPSPAPGPTQLKLPNGTVLAEGTANNNESGSQNGATAPSVTYNGVTYPGGAGGTGNGGNGAGNGAGAAGGNADFGFAPGSKGGNGSVGRSNLVIRQN